MSLSPQGTQVYPTGALRPGKGSQSIANPQAHKVVESASGKPLGEAQLAVGPCAAGRGARLVWVVIPRYLSP